MTDSLCLALPDEEAIRAPGVRCELPADHGSQHLAIVDGDLVKWGWKPPNRRDNVSAIRDDEFRVLGLLDCLDPDSDDVRVKPAGASQWTYVSLAEVRATYDEVVTVPRDEITGIAGYLRGVHLPRLIAMQLDEIAYPDLLGRAERLGLERALQTTGVAE